MPTTLARLKRQMKRNGLTHQAVAEAAGVHRSMVTKVVNGRAVSQPVLDAIEAVLRKAPR